MDNPRPEKVAVVDEVRSRLEDAAASVVTEYRGLTVKEIAQLRRSLTAAGGDYKVFKNTLVRRAIDGSVYAPLEGLLAGPTAIAFVHGDVSAVAKALRDFSRTNAHLVVKGGLLDGALLDPVQLGALADLPSREVLLAQMAGAVQAPLSKLAGLMQALTRNLAYGLKALLDERGGAPEAPAEPVADGAAETQGSAVPATDTPGPSAPREAPAEPAADDAAETPAGAAADAGAGSETPAGAAADAGAGSETPAEAAADAGAGSETPAEAAADAGAGSETPAETAEGE
jgi:large subunit ribosomal protein L10